MPSIALLEQSWSAVKGGGRFGKRMTLILAWGARQNRLGRNRSNSGKDDCSRESQCMALCFPWNKMEVEWEQASVNMIGCPLPEEITFCTRKVPLYLCALLYNTLGLPAPFSFVGSGCLLPVPKGTRCLCRGWPAPGRLRQEACMTILSFPRCLCSMAASYICQECLS